MNMDEQKRDDLIAKAKEKDVKVIGMAFKGSMDNGSFFNSNE